MPRRMSMEPTTWSMPHCLTIFHSGDGRGGRTSAISIMGYSGAVIRGFRMGRTIARRGAIAGATAAGLVGAALATRGALALAADPAGEKPCPPILPTPATPSGLAGSTAPAAGSAQGANGVLGTALPWTQRGGTVNDASCLDRTPV